MVSNNIPGSFKPLRNHCTEVVLLIPCFTAVLVNIQEWDYGRISSKSTSSLKKETSVTMDYTYVSVIKILHFYSYKVFSHNLKFLGSIAHEHMLKVSREKVQLKESILVEFKEFLC
nr:hypothetical protein CFP56_71576 [Quercus suber]